MAILIANNATSRLKIDTAGGSTTLTLRDGGGAKFPDPGGGDFCIVTIEDRRTGQMEICRCTDRVGDVLTVVRAQEGTTAQNFLAGATVSNRLTAGSISSFTGVTEAPTDGNIYGRKDIGWTQTITKVTFDTTIAALVGVNNTQNTAISNLNADVDALEAHDAVIDGQLLAIGSDIDDLEADIVRIDGVDATQDADISSLEGAVATIQAEQTTQNAAIALRAPIANPVFTGNPQAPTPTVGDNDTSLATTEFVTTAVTNGVANRLTDAPIDGLTYGRKNGAWATVVGGASPGPTPPAGPLINGQLWYNSDTGVLYMWYTDGSSDQWVEVAGDTGTGLPVPTAETANLLDNSAFQISQQNGFTDSTSDGVALADQWFMYFFTGATVRGQRVASKTPRGGTYRLRMTINVADTSITNDYVYFQQPLEGTYISRLLFGTTAAKQLMLRFGWKSPAGNYSVTIRNGAFDRSIVLPFTVSAGEANTDVERELLIPGDMAGTWIDTANLGMTVSFAIVGGVQTAPSVWTAGSFVGYAGMSNGTATAAAVFELFDVGLYADPKKTGKAPDYIVPDLDKELLKCLRYWRSLTTDIVYTANVAGAFFGIPYIFTPPMRTTPTLATLATGSISNVATFSYDQPTVDKCRAVATATASGAAQIAARTGTASARM